MIKRIQQKIKNLGKLTLFFMLTSCTFGAQAHDPQNTHQETPLLNQLSQKEIKEGWQLLFDGKTLNGWRKFHGEAATSPWKIEDGALMLEAKGGGDIITEHKYGSFILELDWKISPGGNSGIFYRVVEENQKEIWWSGPEYQILDNDNQSYSPLATEKSASLFALYAASEDHTRPVGQFNKTRLVIKGQKVRHWLNGYLVAEYEINSEDWNDRIAKSKFSVFSKFGTEKRGHIGLQDHGHQVWFRNIKILPLD
ncbi:MAG: hypothetical protein COB49_10400 [Alphaproteobacteria bacterium]|nr:MAG: hypothetical protein COB49_10400 [Alphaproteobacteria bacterium]